MTSSTAGRDADVDADLAICLRQRPRRDVDADELRVPAVGAAENTDLLEHTLVLAMKPNAHLADAVNVEAFG